MVKNDRENSNNNLDQGPAINLVMAPPWGVEMPPLALALLAGQLKAHNIPAKIYDLNIEAWNLLKGSGNIQAWNMENQNQSTPLECLQSLSKGIKDFPHRWGEEIIRNKPLIVGFSVNSRNALISIEIAKSIKNMAPEIFTVFGGPEALSLRNYQGKDGCISAWVLGEGEGPLIKLYDRLSWGDGHKLPNLMDIEGIVHKRRHSFMPWELLSRRVLNHDLDALGDSDFSQFDLKKYEKPYIPALMSRGCVGRCHYCIDRIISGQLRLRSPLKVADECQKLKREYGISHIEFNDLLCNGDKDHLESVCLALIEKGSPVSWSSYAMIRPFMDKQLLALMKKAGCSHLSYGLESGSSRVLKEMGKYYDAIIAGRVLKDTHLAGISASVNLIVGYPGEGADGLEETIAFIRENARYIHQVTNLGTCFICPGSDLEIRPQDFNIVLPVNDYLANWIDKDQSRLKERRQKLERIKELLKELNLAPKVTNMPDFASGQVGKTEMNNIGLGGQLLENGENDNSDINWKIIRLDHYDLKLGQKLDDKLMDIIFQASEKGHFIRIQWPIGLDNEIFLELLGEIGCYSNDYQTKKGLYRLLPWLFDLPQEFTLLELHHPEYNQEKYAFAGNIKKGYQPLWWHDGGLNNNGSRRKLMEKVKNAVQDLEMLCEIIK